MFVLRGLCASAWARVCLGAFSFVNNHFNQGAAHVRGQFLTNKNAPKKWGRIGIT